MCAGLLSGLLLAAPDAEARFGKRSSSSSSDSGSRSSSKSKTHEATAVGDEDSGGDDDDDDNSSSSSSSSHRRGSRGHHRGFSWLDVLGVVVDASVHVSESTTYVAAEPVADTAPTQEFRVETRPESAPLTVRMGANGGAMSGGTALGLFLGIEGEMLGISTHYTGLALPTDDGTSGEDEIRLFEANLTFALWTNPRGRWRVEVGLSGANAPDIGFVGPSFATSLEACLAGPLDIEARLQGVPFPYRQVDAQAGLALHFQALTLRGGWRGLVLDDAGYVGGERHVDALSGPYAGIGLTF